MLQSHPTRPVAAPLQGEHDEARGEASALAATMVITLQRFASLVFSATVLSPAYPPAALWAGICLVALGSVGYLGAPGASPVGTRPFKVQEKKHL